MSSDYAEKKKPHYTGRRLVRDIARHFSVPQDQIDMVVKAVFHTIRQQISEGNRIHLRGFGSFYPIISKNPNSSRYVRVCFRCSPSFKASLNHEDKDKEEVL